MSYQAEEEKESDPAIEAKNLHFTHGEIKK
jgi:hypothetical protein